MKILVIYFNNTYLYTINKQNMKTKKCILIDVNNEEVKEVEIGEEIVCIYNILGINCFEVVSFDHQNDLYVDEEGLLKLTDKTKFFTIEGYPQPLAGNGLIMGFDIETGDSVSVQDLSVEIVKSKVKFFTINEIRKMYQTA